MDPEQIGDHQDNRRHHPARQQPRQAELEEPAEEDLRAKHHQPGLDEKLPLECRLEPLPSANGIADDEADEERPEGIFEVVVVDHLLRGHQIGEATEEREEAGPGEDGSERPAPQQRAGGEDADDPRHPEEDRDRDRLDLRRVFLVDHDEGLLGRIAPGLWLVDRGGEPIRPALRESLAAGRILGRPPAPADGECQRYKRHPDEDRGGVFVKAALVNVGTRISCHGIWSSTKSSGPDTVSSRRCGISRGPSGTPTAISRAPPRQRTPSRPPSSPPAPSAVGR